MFGAAKLPSFRTTLRRNELLTSQSQCTRHRLALLTIVARHRLTDSEIMARIAQSLQALAFRPPDGGGVYTAATIGAREREQQHILPRLRRYTRRAAIKFVSFAFAATVIAALGMGYLSRNDGYITPKEGTGYWLGIAGAALMLILLIYPLRKRIAALRLMGSVSFWFRIHMALGIIGPTLIILHSNFHLGSLNSNIALFAMLIVAGSGLVGRSLYARIHHGLYGQKATIKELLSDIEDTKFALGEGVPIKDNLSEELSALEKLATSRTRGILKNLWVVMAVAGRSRILRQRLFANVRRAVRLEGHSRGWSRRYRRQRIAAFSQAVSQYLTAIRKVAALALFERLFALWHVFHLPLFMLLVLAVVLHVFAVHHY